MSPIDKPRKRVDNPPQNLKKSSRKWVYIAVVLLLVVVAVVAYVVFLNTLGDNQNGSGQNPIAVIETSKGTIRVELFKDKVPNTCDNFIRLANDGFYDGLVFHRVIDDFMIQGGGFYPNGTQKVSPYGAIDLEINPEVRHVDGAIAMARTSAPNSATSQFFINDGAQPQLEPGGVDANGYAVFGVVLDEDSLNVVRAIAALDPSPETKYTGYQNWPLDDIIINSITIEE